MVWMEWNHTDNPYHSPTYATGILVLHCMWWLGAEVQGLENNPSENFYCQQGGSLRGWEREEIMARNALGGNWARKLGDIAESHTEHGAITVSQCASAGSWSIERSLREGGLECLNAPINRELPHLGGPLISGMPSNRECPSQEGSLGDCCI